MIDTLGNHRELTIFFTLGSGFGFTCSPKKPIFLKILSWKKQRNGYLKNE